MTFRFTVYTGEAFDRLAPRAKQGQTVTLTEGKGDGWAWVRAASAGMAPREVRRVRLPARVAEGARSWQPDLAKEAKLFLEMERIPAPGK